MELTREDRILFLRSVFSNFAQIRVQGSENLPATGGAIVVCNHTDLSDGLIQLLYTARPLVFLAKSELFESGSRLTGGSLGLNIEDLLSRSEFFAQFPKDFLADTMSLAGQFIKDVEAVPIIRSYRGGTRRESAGYYRDLTQKILSRLKGGEVIAIYPEGKRSTDGKLLPFRGLAARLALAAGVPIVPCALVGNRGLTNPLEWKKTGRTRTIIYYIGLPIEPSSFPEGHSKKAVKHLTESIQGRVKELLVQS
ncbi:MAG: 1-acyl-sn-glycerol-3-phosphate acyltransferase [Spirochaetia bacterium]|nr:1-acyl-sn-glycerol-3-phosphate acyltransferase [Spirochaetia bacterium]